MNEYSIKTERLEYFFRTYYSTIFRVAFMEVKSHADAEDVIQEVFIKLLRYSPEFESHEHEKAWMIRTTINLCKDFLKSKWNQVTVGMENIQEKEWNNFKLPYPEQKEILQNLSELPEKYRHPLYLFYYEDYSIKEISGILEVPENTVKTRLKRGRQELKKLLSDER